MIITISGLPGSGKDTVGKAIAERLGYRFYSTGYVLGKLAKERGMTINELMKSAEKDESLDRDIDRFSEELGKKEDNFVISSHMAAFFIPHAFKVFLRVEPREGARRVFRDSANREDESYSSLEEAEEALEELVENNRRRYRKLYKHDPYEGKGYDLVIDTTDIPSGEVAERVLGEIKKSGTGKPSSGQPDS